MSFSWNGQAGPNNMSQEPPAWMQPSGEPEWPSADPWNPSRAGCSAQSFRTPYALPPPWLTLRPLNLSAVEYQSLGMISTAGRPSPKILSPIESPRPELSRAIESLTPEISTAMKSPPWERLSDIESPSWERLSAIQSPPPEVSSAVERPSPEMSSTAESSSPDTSSAAESLVRLALGAAQPLVQQAPSVLESPAVGVDMEVDDFVQVAYYAESQTTVTKDGDEGPAEGDNMGVDDFAEEVVSHTESQTKGAANPDKGTQERAAPKAGNTKQEQSKPRTCKDCSMPVGPRNWYCAECGKKKHAMAMKQMVELKKQLGQCTRCTAPKSSHALQCNSCLAKGRASYEKAKEKGKCYQCWKRDAEEGRLRCVPCATAASVSKKRAYQKKVALKKALKSQGMSITAPDESRDAQQIELNEAPKEPDTREEAREDRVRTLRKRQR